MNPTTKRTLIYSAIGVGAVVSATFLYRRYFVPAFDVPTKSQGKLDGIGGLIADMEEDFSLGGEGYVADVRHQSWPQGLPSRGR